MLKVQQLSFAYPDTEELVLRNISFEVNTTKRICILGESGSGKSTLLKLIYGSLDPSTGSIHFKQDKIKGPKYKLIPGHDNMKYVAQDFDLSPYMTVAENVGKHLSNKNVEGKPERIKEVLDVLDLTSLAGRKCVFLSGGQMQRVAIARTLAKLPQFLVLDEPFSQLDASLHIKIRNQLMHYFKEKGMGVLFSSHRADDALGYADELIVMRKGDLIQQGRPREVYLQPQNAYVASLFGKINKLSKEDAQSINIMEKEGGEEVIIYPHEISLNKEFSLQGEVQETRFVGREWEVDFLFKNTSMIAYSPTKIPQGEKVNFKVENYRWV